MLRRLPGLPIKPTIIVHSAHGLQAFRRFDQQLDISSHRAAAAERQAGWIDLLREVFSPYALDSVIDLARVMRLPRFINNKRRDRPVPVTIVSNDGLTNKKIAEGLGLMLHLHGPMGKEKGKHISPKVMSNHELRYLNRVYMSEKALERMDSWDQHTARDVCDRMDGSPNRDRIIELAEQIHAAAVRELKEIKDENPDLVAHPGELHVSHTIYNDRSTHYMVHLKSRSPEAHQEAARLLRDGSGRRGTTAWSTSERSQPAGREVKNGDDDNENARPLPGPPGERRRRLQDDRDGLRAATRNHAAPVRRAGCQQPLGWEYHGPNGRSLSGPERCTPELELMVARKKYDAGTVVCVSFGSSWTGAGGNMHIRRSLVLHLPGNG